MNLSKFRLFWVLAACANLFLTGCAQTTSRQSSPPSSSPSVEIVRAKLEPLGVFFERPGPTHASQSHIVFYRSGQENLPGATGVFVDGTYHASIVQGAWSHLCYKSGPVNLGARQMLVGAQAKDVLDSITAMNLRSAQTHYFRVVQEKGRPVLKPVSQDLAWRELANTRQQVHTISRVAQDCIPGSPPPLVAEVQADTSPLSLEVLFAFDRSDVQAIVPESLKNLDVLLMQWRQNGKGSERVQVVGHADPLGAPENNERLSAARALTVRDYILRRWPEGVQVSVESRGSQIPMVKHCDKNATNTSIACNAPNRRVVVLLSRPQR